MVEAGPERHMEFIEKILTGSEPPSCVDGRPGSKGYKMLGGSLHPIILQTIATNSHLNSITVEENLKKLDQKGFLIGVHRGHHKDATNGKSDCGFADRLVDIIQTAKENKTEIIKRLEGIYRKNGIDTETLSESYDLIQRYDLEKITLTGENLISIAEGNGVTAENIEGDHAEQAAFVNLKKDTTFDSQKANQQGKQAFNLDLWAATEEGFAITYATNITTLRDLSLILYMATEMVLVEQKGKPALEVILRK